MPDAGVAQLTDASGPNWSRSIGRISSTSGFSIRSNRRSHTQGGVPPLPAFPIPVRPLVDHRRCPPCGHDSPRFDPLPSAGRGDHRPDSLRVAATPLIVHGTTLGSLPNHDLQVVPGPVVRVPGQQVGVRSRLDGSRIRAMTTSSGPPLAASHPGSGPGSPVSPGSVPRNPSRSLPASGRPGSAPPASPGFSPFARRVALPPLLVAADQDHVGGLGVRFVRETAAHDPPVLLGQVGDLLASEYLVDMVSGVRLPG